MGMSGSARGYVYDNRTGARGSAAEWVKEFARRWARATTELDPLLDLLGPGIRLSAPGLRPTQGKDAARRAFQRTFAALPDLTGDVEGWGVGEDTLFIEMTFRATVGGRPVEWRNIDRFRFADGVAIERFAFFDPTPIRKAYLGSFSGWVQLLRMRRLR